MESYWRAFVGMKSAAAAGFTAPDELIELRREVLLVFLESRMSSDPEIRAIAAVFFAGVPEADHENLSPTAVYLGVNRIMVTGQPDRVRFLASSSIALDRVERQADGATLRYTIAIDVPGGGIVARAGTGRGSLTLPTAEPKPTYRRDI